MTDVIEKNITILIPSKSYDENLQFCILNIRKYYKKIKIVLVLDNPINYKLDKNIKIIISGNKTIGYKRNLGVKNVNTKFVSLIDSDAYPNSKWLDKVIGLFKEKKIAAVGGPNLSPRTSNMEKKLVARSRQNSIVTLNNKVKSKSTKRQFIKFLPSCNMIIKTSIYRKLNGMDPRLYSGEEISLNYKINKNGYRMIFCPTVFVYHKDRNFKHFARQRFIYGSTGLWLSLRYPIKESFMLLVSSLPILYILLFPVLILKSMISFVYIIGILTLFFTIIVNTFMINYKNNLFKSFKLSLISIFLPGLGLLATIFLSKDKIKKFYTQK